MSCLPAEELPHHAWDGSEVFHAVRGSQTKSGKAIGRPPLKAKRLDAARAALAEGRSIRAAGLAAMPSWPGWRISRTHVLCYVADRVGTA
jgi:hypothetical protein